MPTVQRVSENAVFGPRHAHALAHRVDPVAGYDRVRALRHQPVLLVHVDLKKR